MGKEAAQARGALAAQHGAEADARALRQIVLLGLGGLGGVVFAVMLFIISAIQAVGQIDAGVEAREHALLSRAVALLDRPPDEAALSQLAATFGLDGARPADRDGMAPGEAFLPFATADGRVLAWTPHRPAITTFRAFAPPRIAAVMLIVLVVGVIGWRIVVVGRGLDRRRAAAARLALTDALTGLSNRRAFEAALAARQGAAAGGGDGFALVLLDLDGFKAVNDRYGHDAGDAVLRAVAGHLGETAGEEDLAARIGGDEFAVLRPDAGLDAYLAELRRRFADPVRYGGRRLDFGASIGVALSRDFPDSATKLMRAADVAVYRAKHAGPARRRAA